MYKEEKSFNVLKGIVPDFVGGDIILAFTVNGEERSASAFPNKGEGYKVGETNCENGVKASWNSDIWGLEIKDSNNQRKIKCTINFTRYEETLLNGAYPKLKDGLVAVNIDNEGKVTKANLSEKWYKYEDQEWANAVILTNGKTADSYQDNDPIPEEDIESYFVWIPKYKYQIFDMGEYTTRDSTSYKDNEQAIEIKFGLDDTTDNSTECTAPASGEKGSCSENKWMTHPAFTAFGTNGIWVGKFKTGYKGATNTTDAQQSGDESKIIVKPNEYSWRNISVGTMYKNSLNYKEEYQSHMLKNTEWGAVAYLTNSIYGRCDKTTKECTEIRINNNSNRLTGYAAKNEPTTGYTATNELCSAHSSACNEYGGSGKGQDGTYNYQYFNTESVIASTTNNYTGVYDMSGLAWEYVMGVMVDENDEPIYLNSGLKEGDLKDERYYDSYKYSTNDNQYSNRILGDATGEIGPFILEKYTGTTSGAQTQNKTISGWYHDDGWFVLTGFPWFGRGGDYNYGFESGVFTFARYTGEAYTDHAFRLALAF